MKSSFEELFMFSLKLIFNVMNLYRRYFAKCDARNQCKLFSVDRDIDINEIIFNLLDIDIQSYSCILDENMRRLHHFGASFHFLVLLQTWTTDEFEWVEFPRVFHYIAVYVLKQGVVSHYAGWHQIQK